MDCAFTPVLDNEFVISLTTKKAVNLKTRQYAEYLNGLKSKAAKCKENAIDVNILSFFYIS